MLRAPRRSACDPRAAVGLAADPAGGRPLQMAAPACGPQCGCAVQRRHSACSIVGPPERSQLLSFGLQSRLSASSAGCVSTGVLGLLTPYTSDIGAIRRLGWVGWVRWWRRRHPGRRVTEMPPV